MATFTGGASGRRGDSATNIRLTGAPDLVRGWGKLFEEQFGVSGREYPSRGNSDVRYYINLDDRIAEGFVRRLQANAQAADESAQHRALSE